MGELNGHKYLKMSRFAKRLASRGLQPFFFTKGDMDAQTVWAETLEEAKAKYAERLKKHFANA